MFRAWLALVVLSLGSARGAAPSYSAASVVNTANYAPGPFAPNSILTIFGTGLSTAAQATGPSDIVNNRLPTELNSTQVFIDGQPAPLFYVSDGQVNFVLPGTVGPDPPVLRVVREGLVGPPVSLPLASASPALFTSPTAPGYILASRADYSVISPDKPARSGEIVVLWMIGLGKVQRNPAPGELPNYTSPLADPASLRVTLGGIAVDPARIQYAGLTPLSAGLYQINLVLPDSLPVDPEIRVSVNGQSSPAGVKLAVR